MNFCSLLPSQSAKSEDQTREGSHASGRQLLRSVELHHAWTNIHRIYPSTIRHRDTQTLGYVRISNLGTPLNSKSFHKQFSSEKVPPLYVSSLADNSLKLQKMALEPGRLGHCQKVGFGVCFSMKEGYSIQRKKKAGLACLNPSHVDSLQTAFSRDGHEWTWSGPLKFFDSAQFTPSGPSCAKDHAKMQRSLGSTLPWEPEHLTLRQSIAHRVKRIVERSHIGS